MDNKNNKNNPRNNRQGWGVILFTTLLTLFIVMGLYGLMQDKDPEEISYDKFLRLVDEGKVEKVTLESSRIYITLKEGVEKEEEKHNQIMFTDHLLLVCHRMSLFEPHGFLCT